MMTTRLAAATLIVAAALAAASAAARAEGLYSEADLGARLWAGRMADVAAPGPAFAVHLGWAPVEWFDLGAMASGSTHEATLPPPPSGQMFQVYQVGAVARLGLRAGRAGVYAEALGGAAFLSTNVLDAPGISGPEQHWSPFVMGGAGVELHIDNPRYALGLASDFGLYTAFTEAMSIDVRLYLRYTR